MPRAFRRAVLACLQPEVLPTPDLLDTDLAPPGVYPASQDCARESNKPRANQASQRSWPGREFPPLRSSPPYKQAAPETICELSRRVSVLQKTRSTDRGSRWRDCSRESVMLRLFAEER